MKEEIYYSSPPLEDLECEENPNPSVSRKYKILIAIGIGLLVFLLIISPVTYFIVKGVQNAQQVNQTTGLQAKSSVPISNATFVDTFVENRNEEGKTDYFSSDTVQSEENVDSRKYPCWCSELKPIGFHRIPLFRNRNATYYGRFFLGADRLPFNAIFDSTSSKISLSTVKSSAQNCPTRHCLLDSKITEEIPPGKKTLSLEYHVNDIFFNPENSTSISSQIITKDFSPIFSKEDEIDGIFGLKISTADYSNSKNPIEQFFAQNPRVERTITIYYSKKREDSTNNGELVLGCQLWGFHLEIFNYILIERPGDWAIPVKYYEITSSEDLVFEGKIHFDTKSNFIVGPKEQVVAIAKMFQFRETENKTFAIEFPAAYYYMELYRRINFRVGKNDEINISFLPRDLIEKEGDNFIVLLRYHEEKNHDWIFGTPYFRQYYTIIDLENNQIGIATQHHRAFLEKKR